MRRMKVRYNATKLQQHWWWCKAFHGDPGGRCVFVVHGDGQRVLCVYEEGSVRSPREAQALLRDGCGHHSKTTPLILHFLDAVAAGFSSAFDRVVYEAGRVALHSASPEVLGSVAELAHGCGLSYFDGCRTYAQIAATTVVNMSRCCGVLTDASVGAVVFRAEAASITLTVVDENVRVRAAAEADGELDVLRLLGFRPGRDRNACESIVGRRIVPALIVRTLGMMASVGPVAVTVSSRPLLALVSRRRTNLVRSEGPQATARPAPGDWL
jgi:hypothetical protein